MRTPTKNITRNTNNLSLIKDDIFPHIAKHIRAKNDGFSIVVPHVCNNVNAFGGGFTADIVKHYPIVKENYHMLGNVFLKNNPGYVQFVVADSDPEYGHTLVFANMICQNGLKSLSNARPLNYFSLCKSMSLVSRYIKQNFEDAKVQIHAPKFGCGLAGGNWDFISELIKDIWNNIPTFIYSNNK